jgi:hypothetical protein
MTVRLLPIEVLAALAITALPALATEPTPAGATLRQQFMDCDGRASRQLLNLADATRCSIIYEQLLRHEFKGDFSRLLAWWQAELRRQTAGAAPPQP